MSTYTGKEVTWEQALNSTLDSMPKELAWDAEPPTKPGPTGCTSFRCRAKRRFRRFRLSIRKSESPALRQ
jgi:hypothetical protein